MNDSNIERFLSRYFGLIILFFFHAINLVDFSFVGNSPSFSAIQPLIKCPTIWNKRLKISYFVLVALPAIINRKSQGCNSHGLFNICPVSLIHLLPTANNKNKSYLIDKRMLSVRKLPN